VTLGLVYEQTHRKDAAIKLYEKAMTLILDDENNETHKQIQKFIDTVKGGGSNAVHAKDISQQNTTEALSENTPSHASVTSSINDPQSNK
jgi:mevalonate pyrophosphate decarboxylase